MRQVVQSSLPIVNTLLAGLCGSVVIAVLAGDFRHVQVITDFGLFSTSFTSRQVVVGLAVFAGGLFLASILSCFFALAADFDAVTEEKRRKLEKSLETWGEGGPEAFHKYWQSLTDRYVDLGRLLFNAGMILLPLMFGVLVWAYAAWLSASLLLVSVLLGIWSVREGFVWPLLRGIPRLSEGIFARAAAVGSWRGHNEESN